jgi:preprotein translocase subunit SecE
MKFLKEVFAELKQVTWPKKNTTIMYTFVVIVVSLLVGYYLGLFDFVFQNYGLRSLIQ